MADDQIRNQVPPRNGGSGNNQPNVPAQRPILAGLQPEQNRIGVVRPPIEANFELKPALISMVQQNQFGGSHLDDPNAHLVQFLEVCDTIKLNGVSDDAIKLRLFSFSLRDKAKLWFNSIPPGSITSWDELSRRFLFKYFPPSKTLKMKSEITQFKQLDGESLGESWERFRDMLRRCPQHGFPEDQQVCFFYNGLFGSTRAMIDAAAGGALLAKSPEEAMYILEEMATNSYQWPSERTTYRKVAEIQSQDQVLAAIAALTTQVSALAHSRNQPMDSSGMQIGDFVQHEDVEELNYIGGQNYNNFRNNKWPYQYKHSGRNHENFSYANYNNCLQPPPGFSVTNGMIDEPKKQPLEDLMKEFIKGTDARLKALEIQMDARLKSVERQIGQIAEIVGSQHQKGQYPSNTEVNPKEHCQVIHLRSGTQYEIGNT